MGEQKKSWEKRETFLVPPPCPVLLRTGCCSSVHISQDPQIGLFAANRHLLLLASGSLALQTLLCRTASPSCCRLLPVEPRFADKGSRKNRKSPGVWPISTPHTSVSPFLQRAGRRKRWRVHLPSGVLLRQQHLLFPAKVSAALSPSWIPRCCWLPKCHTGQKITFSFCQRSDNFCLILLGTAPTFDLSG